VIYPGAGTKAIWAAIAVMLGCENMPIQYGRPPLCCGDNFCASVLVAKARCRSSAAAMGIAVFLYLHVPFFLSRSSHPYFALVRIDTSGSEHFLPYCRALHPINPSRCSQSACAGTTQSWRFSRQPCNVGPTCCVPCTDVFLHTGG
jgi:hypothetical protein